MASDREQRKERLRQRWMQWQLGRNVLRPYKESVSETALWFLRRLRPLRRRAKG